MSRTDSSALKGLVSGLVAPATVTTAALYYFGWLRSQTIAQQFGYDASLLGLSGQDLILRAVQPVASLAVVGAVVAWPLLLGHRGVIRAMDSGRGPIFGLFSKPLTTKLMRWLGALASILALVWTWRSFDTAPIYLPALFLIAAMLVGYGTGLQRYENDKSRDLKLSREIEGLVIALGLSALFIALTFFAQQSGRAQAALNLEVAQSNARVTLTSATPLELVGIEELAAGDQYVSNGLTLLFSENGQHFLLPATYHPDSNARLFIVPADGVRLGFDKSWAVPCAGFEDLSADDRFEVGEQFRSGGIDYDVIPIDETDSEAESNVTVQSFSGTGNALALTGVMIQPHFSGPYEEWLLRFVQQEETVALTVDEVEAVDATFVAFDSSNVFDETAEVSVAGSNSGSIRIRGGHERLTRLAIGGNNLLIDCDVNLRLGAGS